MNAPAPLQLPPGYTQRTWTAADLTEITKLDALIFGPDAWSYQLFEAEYQASNAANPHTFYQVITHNHDLVGFAGIIFGPPFADITTIGIHPDHVGKKLGAALLIWCIRIACALGAKDILLEVRADNHTAQRLYADNGFTHIHTRPKYYPGGIDAWIMRKHLREPETSSRTKE
ncbi:MAG TPA: GNAT family N-acetyltransferase [Enteractinococcus helveticum]|uniref:GNAT family N-acetyltransferase n=1 Tax=Enteractinococcus helveticum TaxID=1837282 RepID=A0A921FN27_9MICC|nr:GNAT family N-acetyltransferase [Enteractinococcus helveticum]HJF14923.1 GNAT family N-acetyltransferase [Enteractinococcus helveticum]